MFKRVSIAGEMSSIVFKTEFVLLYNSDACFRHFQSNSQCNAALELYVGTRCQGSFGRDSKYPKLANRNEHIPNVMIESSKIKRLIGIDDEWSSFAQVNWVH